jgi:tripartite ATP-independent transporter DctP family solute receptor
MDQHQSLIENRLSRRNALRLGVLAAGSVATTGILARTRSSRAAGPFEMKLGSDSPASNPITLAFEVMKKEVESKSEGRLKATIFPDAQLGDETAMTNGLKIGSVDALWGSTGVQSASVPELGLFDLFFLFRDLDHMLRFANSPAGATFKAKIEAAVGGEVLGWGTAGTRNMWNSKRPIKTVQDLKGLKMRVQASRIQQEQYAALGALPTPIAFPEVYTALQTGVVDGGDIGVADMLSVRLYEVTKYMTLTRHFFINGPLLFSKRFIQQLGKQDQEIVREAGRKAVAADIQLNNEQEVSGIEHMKAKGLQVFEMDKQSRDELARLVEPIHAKHAAEFGGAALLKQIRDMA